MDAKIQLADLYRNRFVEEYRNLIEDIHLWKLIEAYSTADRMIDIALAMIDCTEKYSFMERALSTLTQIKNHTYDMYEHYCQSRDYWEQLMHLLYDMTTVIVAGLGVSEFEKKGRKTKNG